MDLNDILINAIWFALAALAVLLGWNECRRRRYQFETAVSSLELAIRAYRDAVYRRKLKALRQKFDLRQGSATRAHEQFIKARRMLLEESARHVVRLMSSELRNCLLDYYSEEGLALLVAEYLERE